MTVSRSPEYRRASWQVLRWASWYTRGLDAETAGERLDELAADLHDQVVWADEIGLSPRELNRSITRRRLWGVWDDLSWRRTQLRGVGSGDPLGVRAKRQNHFSFTIVSIVGVAMVVAGGLALAKTATYFVQSSDTAVFSIIVALAGSLVLGIVGLGLLAATNARFFGAISLLISAAGVIHFSFRGLLYGSATVNNFMYVSAVWPSLKYALFAAAGLVFASAAILWWPPIIRKFSTHAGTGADQ